MTRLPSNKPHKPRIKRSVWLPALLLIYLFGMTIWFAPSLIEGGETLRLVLVFAAELAVIIVLRQFLIKKEKQDGDY